MQSFVSPAMFWKLSLFVFRARLSAVEQADGGPLLYRSRHRARLWRAGEMPKLETQVVEGDPKFSV